MTFYVAGRMQHGDNRVRQIRDILLNHGYKPTFDWTTEPSLRPYLDHKDEAIQASIKMKRGAMEADLFVLVWDESLYGALIELGMFLATSSVDKPKKIFIVGQKERVVIFEMLPEFTVVSSVEQLIQNLS